VTIVAFAGPSLPEADRSQFDSIEWRPPAEAGDLLRLNAEPGTTICLIDGYFDHRPAVRHKEILLLLSQGVRMFGASSIGALRAAEMHGFGMTGVGAIWRAYARGTIEGDDEVALIHASAERDWRALSVPLVDVRATLCRARRETVLRADEARALLRAAAAIHYIDRTWHLVLAGSGLAERLGAFAAWLRTNEVSQKNLDAKACIRAALRGANATAFERPRLVRSVFLDALARDCGLPPPKG
jgi:hypothetical protein